MKIKQQKDVRKQSRRDFVKTSSLIAGGMLAMPLVSPAAGFFTGSSDKIKIALIGCGGRGTGAAVQALSTKQNVELVAMADAFRDRLDGSYNNIGKALKENSGRLNVKEENKFIGFDAYKKAMPLADVVILATPPGFRPIHFEEAVRQNKQIFMEKPVATDPAGIQKVIQAAQIAKEKKLNVVVGLQRHYQNSYRELYKRVQDGMIGDILSGQVYWNMGALWVRPRKPEYTEMEYQMRNWYYFTWLCGDHIVEQHIHNIDVMNWFTGKQPVRAVGTGGRSVRTGNEFGEIFDHHYVEYTYGDGVIMNSQCRQWAGADSRVDEVIIGTKGMVLCNAARIQDHKGKVLYQFEKEKENNPYQTEHDELFEAIANNQYKFHDAERGAQATLTAIIGRLATYSGQTIEWNKALNSGLSIMPTTFDFNVTPPVSPDENGDYAHAIPGKTKYFA